MKPSVTNPRTAIHPTGTIRQPRQPVGAAHSQLRPHQEVCALDSGLAQVGVRVEAGDQRPAWPKSLAHLPKHISIGLIESVGNHSAMQGERHPVDARGLAHL